MSTLICSCSISKDDDLEFALVRATGDRTIEFEWILQASKYRKTSQNHWEFMLKKKDPSKAMWKRLIKSPAKVNAHRALSIDRNYPLGLVSMDHRGLESLHR